MLAVDVDLHFITVDGECELVPRTHCQLPRLNWTEICSGLQLLLIGHSSICDPLHLQSSGVRTNDDVVVIIYVGHIKHGRVVHDRHICPLERHHERYGTRDLEHLFPVVIFAFITALAFRFKRYVSEAAHFDTFRRVVVHPSSFHRGSGEALDGVVQGPVYLLPAGEVPVKPLDELAGSIR